jgi:hypothetical protein
MSVSTITVGGQPVTLVAMPSSPGARSIEFGFDDAVSTVTSTFTGQKQAQRWPGADMLSGTFTLPALTRVDAANWIAFLMQLRGMTFAFQLGDPLNPTPLGAPSGTPVVAAGNLAMSETLATSGWTVDRSGLLLPGDWIQIGYRMHRVLDNVTSDDSGNATFQIFPTLREIPTTGVAVVSTNPKGLFRLSMNSRKVSFDITRLSHMSFQFQEYR